MLGSPLPLMPPTLYSTIRAAATSPLLLLLPSCSSSTVPPPIQTSCSALGNSPYLFTPSPTPPYSRQLAQQACSCTTSARRFPWSSSPIHGSRHRFTTALKRTLGLAFTP